MRAFSSAVLVISCAASPPKSKFPTADDALDRMRATNACSRGVEGESKVDYFGEEGRLRASMLFVASRPDRVRFDLVSPFGATLSTLTSNGQEFQLLDIGHKEFFEGPASACTLARFLQVPVAPRALVTLLGGEAPVLVHAKDQAALAWEGGAYVVRIQSKHDATETIQLVPRPQDWSSPWETQQVRILSVTVRQRGVELYRAELSDFTPTKTSPPRTDPDGIDPDIPPSGPPCGAEIPRKVHLVSEATGRDVLLRHHELFHNPPLSAGVFLQRKPEGTRRVMVSAMGCR